MATHCENALVIGQSKSFYMNNTQNINTHIKILRLALSPPLKRLISPKTQALGAECYNVPMEITAALQPDDLAELDRVCRQQHVSPAEALHEAVRFYIEREGDLPTIPFDDEHDLA